jgi:hypothetical protein
MSVQPAVRALLKRLATADGQTLPESIHRARLMMERTTKRFANAEVKRRAYEWRLSRADLARSLTDEEVDEVARALIALVERPVTAVEDRRVAASAAKALHGAARLWVLPHLAAALRRWRSVDPGAARGPAWAMADLLYGVRPGGALTEQERGWIAEAAAELSAAAEVDGADASDLRDTARGPLAHIEQLLRPAT